MPLDHLSARERQDLASIRIAYPAQSDKEPSWPEREEEEVVQQYGSGDDEGLDTFDAVHTCEDVDAVGGKCREEEEVDVVEGT